eukprot:8450476-Pyramimonas_sp.AAC.1
MSLCCSELEVEPDELRAGAVVVVTCGQVVSLVSLNGSVFSYSGYLIGPSVQSQTHYMHH